MSQSSLDPRLAEYIYELPEELIARFPPPERDGGRLMVVGEERPHRRISDLPELLAPGDLLVVNDTRVLAARVHAHRQSGGGVELLLLGAGPGPVEALLRPSRRLKVGEELRVEGAQGRVQLLESRGEGRWLVQSWPEPAELMERVGQIPLPPYLRRAAEELDRERYQTVYAGPLGASAAPTAGLHLSPALLEALSQRGVELARVTLHVGLGTFRELRAEDLDRGELHEEPWSLPMETGEALARCRDRGGRVVAVGTTSARALESAALASALGGGAGRTRLFIQPGFRFQVVDRLLTNLHLPGSSLMMLVSAFAGRETIRAAYAEAVAQRYRFFSYGDAMWLRPPLSWSADPRG